MYLQAFGSFADVEASHKKFEETIAANAAFKADLDRLDREEVDQHASQRTAYYTARSDLSYHPHTTEQVARSRFVSVNTTRIKPGRAPDYVEYIKALNVAREKAGIDVHTAVYQVATNLSVEFPVPSMTVMFSLATSMDPPTVGRTGATTHTFAELAPHLAVPAVAGAVAQERVLRGEDLREVSGAHGEVLELPRAGSIAKR